MISVVRSLADSDSTGFLNISECRWLCWPMATTMFEDVNLGFVIWDSLFNENGEG